MSSIVTIPSFVLMTGLRLVREKELTAAWTTIKVPQSQCQGTHSLYAARLDARKDGDHLILAAVDDNEQRPITNRLRSFRLSRRHV